MDGYDAVRRLRDQGIDQPIIALTAHAMKGVGQHCLEAGFTDYVSRPIERTAFLDTVARYLAPPG